MPYPRLIEQVLEKLTKLPGIGRRSAERIVFWILAQPTNEVRALAESLDRLKSSLHFCRICNNLSDTEICVICSDPGREEGTLCVVENPQDLLAIEKTGAFRGRYHVLLGVLAPAEGLGPDELHVHRLISRVKQQNIREVVLATDPDIEGEMTALYIVKELKPTGVRVSRIGLGIPVGSSVEFADLSTLTMSLSSRRVME